MTVSGGSLAVLSIAQGTVQLSSGGQISVAPNGTSAGLSVVNDLTVTGSSKLDLNNNSVIVDYTASSPIAALRLALVSGSGGGWTGNGITSSAAAAAVSAIDKTALGYAEASAVLTYSNGTASFMGYTLAQGNDAVLIRYTLAGDSDLSGSVDLTDFTYLAANFNGSNKSWLQGDYNYDGAVDLTDFTFLASNFNQNLPAAGIGALAPEPAAIALLILPTVIVRRRRAVSAR
jgi:hypothetical protein